MSFSIINPTQEKLPKIDFSSLKSAALGDAYALNLIFVSGEEIRKLNTMYRNRKEATDILSFPLSKDEGEIYICAAEARTEAKKFGREFENFLAFLFIHGCAHLKGYDHGDRMEQYESEIRKKFGI